MNIHLPAILGFTRYQGFDPSPIKETTVWKTTLLWKSPCEGKVKHQTKWTIYTSSQTISHNQRVSFLSPDMEITA
jgi:hypothetical protein